MPEGDNPLYRNQQKQQARQLSAKEEQDSASQCPACGNAVRVTADICEHCSHWLKEGQCCFCYTEVKAGQKFCRECGNPPLGITCPQCNTFSQFDFCPSCNTALSKRSKPYLEAFQQSPAFAELLQLSKMAESGELIPDKKALEIPNHLDQLKAYLQQFEKSADKKQSGFAFTNENTDASEALENAAKQQNIPQPLDNSAAEKELMKKIALLQQQTFTDNQSARLFYTAIKVLLPQMIKIKDKRVIGWLCNFAGVIHAAPHECSEPNLGGEWQYETITSYDTTYSEH